MIELCILVQRKGLTEKERELGKTVLFGSSPQATGRRWFGTYWKMAEDTESESHGRAWPGLLREHDSGVWCLR